MFTIEEFKAKKEAIANQQKELQNSLTDIFNKGIKELFDKYPNHLAQISWRQYTPYFNDGDPCTFRVSEFYINGQEAYDYGDDIPEIVDSLYTAEEKTLRDAWQPDPSNRWDYKSFYTGLSTERVEEFKTAEKEVYKFLGLFSEDDYEFMFDDHVKVTITRDGISVDEYDHD
jgi:hypothetical protein